MDHVSVFPIRFCTVHKLEVVSLFHSLIGVSLFISFDGNSRHDILAEVQSFRDVMEGGNLRLELTFFDQDAAT